MFVHLSVILKLQKVSILKINLNTQKYQLKKKFIFFIKITKSIIQLNKMKKYAVKIIAISLNIYL